MASPINTIVILVQENRSFDHMLGWMKSINPEIDGVTGKESNLLSASNHESKRLFHTNKAGFIQPDPGHSFEATYEQIFGVEWSEATHGLTPTMDGFAQQAEKVQEGLSEVVMSGFHPDSLSVYKELISEFAVCDRWFSSIPTLTQPNRLYVHSATSYGATTNDNKMMIEGYPQKTIFESVEDNGFSFGIYYQLPPSTLFYRYFFLIFFYQTLKKSVL
ncbi:putative phospholipase C [Helianthus anomalus]